MDPISAIFYGFLGIFAATYGTYTGVKMRVPKGEHCPSYLEWLNIFPQNSANARRLRIEASKKELALAKRLSKKEKRRRNRAIRNYHLARSGRG